MTSPFEALVENIGQVVDLFTLHEEKNADKATHHKYEVLVKSAIVLLVACWEAFIEDTAEKAVDFLIEKTDSPTKLPKEILKFVSSELKNNKNEIKLWELAGDGWKKVVKDHYREMLKKHLGPFNTPRAGNVDTLYNTVLGLENLSSCWVWKGMPNKTAKDKLSDIIAVRGAIAHRVQASKRITRRLANNYGMHLVFLAIKTNNCVRDYVYGCTGQYPWRKESHKSVR